MNDNRRKIARQAFLKAQYVLKRGDRIGCTACPGTKRVFTFSHWYGESMVSKSGKDEYHPVNVYSVNGIPTEFRSNE